MSILDDASRAGGGLAVPDGSQSVELKGEKGTWALIFQTNSGEVRVQVPNITRGMKLLERAQTSIKRDE